jgi:osmoprotectant transport system ATP-binding protein
MLLRGAVVVRLSDVTVQLGGRRVLGPLNLEVPRGATVVLVGRSGSGKTTTLRLVNRLLEPTRGEVTVLDRSATDWDPVRLRRSIGYVIQEGGLFPHMTVSENVGIVPRLEGWPQQRRRERVSALLDMVGMPAAQFADRAPHQLSGGQRQRVGVARALAADPDILLCDEPFGAVDPITRADLQREFASLTARLEKTVLFVTHDVREALTLGDVIVVLEEGSAAFVGTPEVFRDSDHPLVRDLRALL